MAKWEYTLETLHGNDFPKDKERLNELGNEGWELVAVIESGVYGRGSMPVAYFKRPKKEGLI